MIDIDKSHEIGKGDELMSVIVAIFNAADRTEHDMHKAG